MTSTATIPCSLQGDDYIMSVHPPKKLQAIPAAERLRAWYHTMFEAAVRYGAAQYATTLFDWYFQGGRDHVGAPATVN